MKESIITIGELRWLQKFKFPNNNQIFIKSALTNNNLIGYAGFDFIYHYIPASTQVIPIS